MLRDDDLGAALIEVRHDGVRVEGLVGDQGFERHALDQWWDPDRIEALPRQKYETDQVAERIGQRQNLGRHAGRLWAMSNATFCRSCETR